MLIPIKYRPNLIVISERIFSTFALKPLFFLNGDIHYC